MVVIKICYSDITLLIVAKFYLKFINCDTYGGVMQLGYGVVPGPVLTVNNALLAQSTIR